ncbi:MAG: FAD-dependent oxidoreductase [Oscillospiraceae bacterium]|nr:FAD-dependent oxidoreductase [Oscillospiraceae bacterium]
MTEYDVAVIGAGPAGLAAALAADKKGARVLLVEREARAGGILKQCIHDGFGVLRFGEKLAGCEYAARYVEMLGGTGIELSLLTYVTRIEKQGGGFALTLVSRADLRSISAKALVLATGCRERTAKQVDIHGTRPAGVFTAGTAQYFINILGGMPAKRCVILGSGDIGLIMARRLTLEGAQVLGVYEAKLEPSGLSRNLAQCLDDFDIPLHLSKTVTRLHGVDRLTAVTVADVDAHMRPLEGTEQIIDCDTLILSVGLIPENELAEGLSVPMDPRTKGPVCDQNYETLADGVFSCGNALHVNDLVDYVSESGDGAGAAAAAYAGAARECVELRADDSFLYAVPGRINVCAPCDQTVLFFRSRAVRENVELRVALDGETVFAKRYRHLRPPEMERIVVDFSAAQKSSIIEMTIREAQ